MPLFDTRSGRVASGLCANSRLPDLSYRLLIYCSMMTFILVCHSPCQLENEFALAVQATMVLIGLHGHASYSPLAATLFP